MDELEGERGRVEREIHTSLNIGDQSEIAASPGIPAIHLYGPLAGPVKPDPMYMMVMARGRKFEKTRLPFN